MRVNEIIVACVIEVKHSKSVKLSKSRDFRGKFHWLRNLELKDYRNDISLVSKSEGDFMIVASFMKNVQSTSAA